MSEIALFQNDEFELEITPHDADGFRVQAPGLARALSVADAHTLLRSIPDEEKGAALVRTPEEAAARIAWLPIVLAYLEENGVDADSLLIQLGAAGLLAVPADTPGGAA